MLHRAVIRTYRVSSAPEDVNSFATSLGAVRLHEQPSCHSFDRTLVVYRSSFQAWYSRAMHPGDLNDEQYRAVQATEGPLLIVAGPGTGKTKTLTARIVHILDTGKAKPSEVLALTFTNKAASEMRQRVLSQRAHAAMMPKITTFHGLCYELLSNETTKPPSFITDQERIMTINELRKAKQQKDLSTRELSLEISRLKNMPLMDMLADMPFAGLLEDYNAALKKRNVYDFDDLLQQTQALLTKTSQPLPYRYILVDEFQDTNRLQYELLQLLRQNENICVIGDPLQSIYGFRGASSDVFTRFMADFPDCSTINLTTNYRSSPEVVTLANELFSDAPRLHAHSTKVGRVETVEVLNEYSEATWVVNYIEEAIGGSSFLQAHQQAHADQIGHSFRDFAVLYRTHHNGATLKRAFSESGIPCQIAGGGSPYDEPTTQVIVQVLRYLTEPSQERRAALGFLKILKHYSTLQLDILLDTLSTKTDQPLGELAQAIITTFQLDAKTLNQFFGTLVRFDQTDLATYVDYLNELDENYFYDPKADVVSLMTIHAAKGLEFKHVFLIGCEEGVMPYQSPQRTLDREEEKRLFYVAITRAKETLHLLHTQTRGGKRTQVTSFIQPVSPAVLPCTKDNHLAQDHKRSLKRHARRRQSTLFDL